MVAETTEIPARHQVHLTTNLKAQSIGEQIGLGIFEPNLSVPESHGLLLACSVSYNNSGKSCISVLNPSPFKVTLSMPRSSRQHGVPNEPIHDRCNPNSDLLMKLSILDM